jgi:ribosomal protein S18 acetylase RimI-like enzyme
MAISASISRLAAYYTRHGLGATIRRGVLAVVRGLFSNRMVVFYCDLAEQTTPPADLPSNLSVERLRSYAELNPQDLHQIIDAWNPKLSYRKIDERFGKGALLWLIKSEGRLAGYGWSLQGSTIEPHYFPLGEHDAHLFDFLVFPEYRGRGLNPTLVGYILGRLSGEGAARAFIDTVEWNRAELSSLGKTPFCRLGSARKSTIFGRTIVCWAENKAAEG